MEDEWNMGIYFPPLFGIPTSIKENIDMENTRSTLGVTIRADRFVKEDCATIKCMKFTGLIPFIKTNLPQLAFNFDCNNFLWGRALNPWNPKKSPGGSSGGEGAAIAARISPVGIGNDMAGSIRIPAAFNGVCGLCPSADRLPFRKQIW
jgi:Asp-tRNA(Asn)/Glu-tRNA(Gln) amidotransferase A subunit family amidase